MFQYVLKALNGHGQAVKGTKIVSCCGRAPAEMEHVWSMSGTPGESQRSPLDFKSSLKMITW